MLSAGEGAMSRTARAAGCPAPFLRQPARFDILSRRVPRLGGACGADERAAADEILRRLHDLNACVGDFRAGLKLFEHAEANAAFAWSWAPIACHDSGRALARFREALKGLRAALKSSASMKGARKALRPVEERFAVAFPTERVARNGGGRGEAAGALPRRHDDMADAAIVAQVSRAGRDVRHALGGRAIRFELSEQTLWRLVAMRNDAFSAFEGE
jgi:hypothetical protein